MRRTGVHFQPGYERHNTGTGHPESAHRYRILSGALDALPAGIVRLPGRAAAVTDVLLAHDPDYVGMVRQDVENYEDSLRTGDTAICKASYDVTLEATGALLAAADSIVHGEVSSAFCAVRPPGHHATASRGMGFCIFNHVAIGARYLQSRHGLKKIAVIDWDVHHGNGTEAIFLKDPSVLYVSLHEKNIYPFTGPSSEVGQGAGEGTTLNIPLPSGTGGDVALAEWQVKVEPAVDRFRPDFILISAGFDARDGDPIGGLHWSDETFARMTRSCVRMARKWCGGKILSSLEGGYNPDGLASAAVAHIMALNEAGAS